MTEREFQSHIEQMCQWMRLRYYHTHDSRRSVAGFPDLVIVGKKAVVFAELKTDKGKVSAAQADWLESLKMAGQIAVVWRPSDLPEITAYLRDLARG